MVEKSMDLAEEPAQRLQTEEREQAYSAAEDDVLAAHTSNPMRHSMQDQ